jgi:hypothetical protein
MGTAYCRAQVAKPGGGVIKRQISFSTINISVIITFVLKMQHAAISAAELAPTHGFQLNHNPGP